MTKFSFAKGFVRYGSGDKYLYKNNKSNIERYCWLPTSVVRWYGEITAAASELIILYETLLLSSHTVRQHHHHQGSSFVNPSVNTTLSVHTLPSAATPHPLIPLRVLAGSCASLETWGCGTPSTARHSRNIIKHILFTVAEIITLNSIIWLLRYFLAVRA